MKKSITLLLLVACCIYTKAQPITIHADAVSATSEFLGLSQPLRNLPEVPVTAEMLAAPHVIRDNPSLERPMPSINLNALPQGADPARQQNYTPTTSATVLSNWTGLQASVEPSDNTIAIGPNHVFQMTNNNNSTYIRIWDKAGNLLVTSKLVSSLDGNIKDCGDPNVIYDAQADRYIMLVLNSCSFSNKKLVVLMSQTNDPTGAYYVYTVSSNNGFPDYPKISSWGNSYFITINGNSPTIFALNRNKMISGKNLGTIQTFNLSSFPKIGFQAASPVHIVGTSKPPSNEPAVCVRVADDAWGSTIGPDHLELFLLSINWQNSALSTITGPVDLNTIPYDSKLCSFSTESCIPQPSGSKLDPLSNIVMDKVQYRKFSDHEAIVASHVCNADGNGTAGIRWYELRRDASGNWFIYQQGTYQPNTTNRWMSSISLNGDGSIALGYNLSSTSVFPSGGFTGRAACDPLNSMTVAENVVAVGAASNSSNRYGDYNGMMADLTDNSFWLTTQYNPTSSWATNVCHFTVTSCSGPVAPANIVANNITNNSIELTWTGQETPDYIVRYREAGTEEWNVAGNSNMTNFIVNELKPGTQYEFSVAGIDKDRNVLTSEKVSATTLINAVSREQSIVAGSIYGLSIAPVPASNQIQITFNSQVQSPAHIQIFNLNGQEVFSANIGANYGVNTTTADVHTLQNGYYLLKLSTDQSVNVERMVIQR